MSQWITREKRLAIYMRDNFTCCYCGRSLKNEDPNLVTLDHLVPRNKKVAHGGGGNEATNVVTSCKSCNSSRQDKPWLEFAPGGAIERIEHLRCQPLNMKLAKAIIFGEIDAEVAALEDCR